MEEPDKTVTETEMRTLREGVKNKYRAYHLLNKDRFPTFAYNTSRANYEPLKESFEEEFFVVRGIDRMKSSVHIPSTNTLALIFSDDHYVPGTKILNTCRSYADVPPAIATEPIAAPASTPAKPPGPFRNQLLLLAGLAGLAGGAVYVFTASPAFIAKPSGLTVDRPSHNRVVPREVLAVGRASGADTVWLVVRPVKSTRYWVQPPIEVDDDDTWRGTLYIGSENQGDIGVRSQIRAFVNPSIPLTEGAMLHDWPPAALSTKAIEVIRGAERE